MWISVRMVSFVMVMMVILFSVFVLWKLMMMIFMILVLCVMIFDYWLKKLVSVVLNGVCMVCRSSVVKLIL